MTTPLVLRTDDVHLRFGGVVALEGVDVAVREREIVGLLGPNGAGKTTLFDVIAGFRAADRGSVLFRENTIDDLHPWERVAAGVARTFQQVRLFPDLTVTENLFVAQHRRLRSGPLAALLRSRTHRRDEEAARAHMEEVLDVIDLRPWRDERASDLSYGTLRMLQIACAISVRPAVLLLDEPTAGIAQREAEALAPLLRRIREDWGIALVVIEHDIPLLASLADWIYALHQGRVIAEGKPGVVLASEDVLESYLGRTGRAPR